MNDMSNSKKNRREFIQSLWKGALTGTLVTAGTASSAEGTEKIQMLTADGKLVEVDRSAEISVKKSSNKEILKWRKDPSKT